MNSNGGGKGGGKSGNKGKSGSAGRSSKGSGKSLLHEDKPLSLQDRKTLYGVVTEYVCQVN